MRWADLGYFTHLSLIDAAGSARTIASFKEGDFATDETRLTKAKVFLFALASGDMNPLHLSPLFAAGTRFKRPIVHGMLVASQISALIASKLPGTGTLYRSQSINFLAPVYLNDTVKTTITITHIDRDKGIIALHCKIEKRDDDGKLMIVIEGTAEVQVRKK